jgi:hypothetical protein
MDGKEGITALKKVIDKIKQGIEQYRGIYKEKREPRIVTAVDEQELEVN